MSESKKLSSEVASQLDQYVIRYSRVLEDHRVLSRALNITPEQDIILSITRYPNYRTSLDADALFYNAYNYLYHHVL